MQAHASAPHELVDPERYQRSGYPYEDWRRMRREAPVCRIEGDDSFWALTRQQEIRLVSRQPQLFSNLPRFQLFAGEGEGGFDSRTVISMDPPEHREYRALVSPRFTPRALGLRVPRSSGSRLSSASAGRSRARAASATSCRRSPRRSRSR